MTQDLLLALAAFALVTVITPGPNNLMLLASGANFGFRRSIPHMLGIGLGFPAMVLLVGLGVMQVFEAWPVAHDVLLVASVIYMLWLAWKIAHAAPPAEAGTEPQGRPLSFVQAAAFQWVNPKAWSMALGAITLYATGRDLGSVMLVAGTYVAMSVISTSTWTVLGREMRRVLNNPGRLRAFNWTMAALLIASLLPVLAQGQP
ncbi:LysE family translocator [Salipiger sp. P9]|uniref:LysE family translocator n=1 Tax=Salipiger pentaromativorans TaxID=2943193 RepID=UPI002158399A|nr:LysE family translocator [Salipiger pentaromativorans]MCR8549304.1 LysE family translocator [Salipiger pentaromativorans]